MNSTTARGVAITGMACLFPGAPDLDAYWRNILGKVDATSDPPPEAWDPDVYYDPEFADPDRTYCKRGGYLGSLATFDPLAYGIPPVSVGGEPDQWLSLKVAHDALLDAGASDLPAEIRERTAIILGKGTYLNGGNAIAVQRGLVVGQTIELIRRLHPEHSDAELEQLREQLQRQLPPLGPETVPGLIPNVIVGRIANRLDLMGPAYTVDAACASSLVAVRHAVRDLLAGDCDLALAGGSQVWMPVATMNLFCRLGALSHRERLRAFDKDADGTLLGEGIGIVVLKRVADAVRDGDRVYAVIRGVGVSSDGRALGVMAPRVEGEELALRRAYADADVSPDSVGLLEAHGTGTPVGDLTEVQALRRVFGDRGEELPRCALGTVKSMISHTIPAAGVAGLIKTALALHHRVLPPTLCDEPNPKLELERTQFYLNTEPRPWIHGGSEPRRAGINAFGFGGINAHAVLEEWGGPAALAHRPPWDSEVCILEAQDAAALADRAAELQAVLHGEPVFTLSELASALAGQLGTVSSPRRLAIVATSLDDLREKLVQATRKLRDPGCRRIKSTGGIYYESEPFGREAKVVLVFPGEGAQYPNMLSDLVVHFPEARAAFDRIDRLYSEHPRRHVLSDWVYPRPAFSDDQRRVTEQRLMDLDIAVESVLTANAAAYAVVSRLVPHVDAIVGHSTGEHSAAMASGALDLDSDDRLATFCLGLYAGYADADARHEVSGAALLAIGTGAEEVKEIAAQAGGELYLAMDNCPHQAVLVGDGDAIDRAREIATGRGLMSEQLPYDRAVHTPLFAPFAEDLRDVFAQLPVRASVGGLWSCTTAAPYPDDPEQIRELLVEHWTSPVRFRETIEALHADGARVFVEVGPRGNMTTFVEDVLRGTRFCAVATDVRRRTSVAQLCHLAAMLAVHDVELDLDVLFGDREIAAVDWRAPVSASNGAPALTIPLSTSWPMLRLDDDTAAALRPAATVSDGSSNGHDPAIAEDQMTVALEGHLQTMERFLLTGAEVMEAYLDGAAPVALEQARRPLVGSVVRWQPESELVARRAIDPAEDRYLLHHTLGREVSRLDPELTALAVMPLAMTIEIIAEAASCLVPGRVVIGLRKIRAHRWLTVSESAVTVEVTARRLDADCVRVELHLLDDDVRRPVAEGTVVLGDDYGPAPAPNELVLDGARPARWREHELYDEAMFHQPLWQGVHAIDSVGAGGATGRLRVLPRLGVLRGTAEPDFVLDPVVLDAAGQVVGFWAAECLDRAHVVFPFRVAAIDLYGPPAAEGELLECRASIALRGEQLTSSDVDVIAADGRLQMRLLGWEDKRFDVPDRFRPLTLPGPLTPLSSASDVATSDDRVACRRLDTRLGADTALWKPVWAARVLGRRERAVFETLRTPERRQLEWLGARTAAKEAVIQLARRHAGLDLLPADVEILPDDRGAPVVVAPGLGRTAVVSLAHTNGAAFALAVLGDGVVGIDVEHVHTPPDGFGKAAFSERELELVEPAGAEHWLLRCWCAREAAAKSVGRGLLPGPGAARVAAIDVPSETVSVDVEGRNLLVRTQREQDLLVATIVELQGGERQ
jgi:acyl transferase domain-containing protein/phosphopantetheinyl transferase (holo-ACP synthase)